MIPSSIFGAHKVAVELGHGAAIPRICGALRAREMGRTRFSENAVT